MLQRIKRQMMAALVITAAVIALASPSRAFDDASTASVNVSATGLALRGYDPVAYFTRGKATPGSPEFTATHDGAKYLFATAAHRDAFLKDPANFAPQYGGFCAYAAALGRKADAEPTVWKIIDGKLYVNYNAPTGERWSADTKGYIAKANANWSAIKEKAPGKL